MYSIEWWISIFGVAFLGVQTSIGPCTLTTNIVAISYMARKVTRPADALLSGVFYTLGRSFVYVLLAVLILSSFKMGGESLTRFFQAKLHAWLGPLMILIGMMLCGLISFSFGSVQGEKMGKFADRLGIWSAFPLGAVFALAFCPTSAATFLATVAIAAANENWPLFPIAFGIGSAIPVLIFAAIIALNARLLEKAFKGLSRLDFWTRNTTGIVFILAGIHLSLRDVYGLY